MTTHPVQHAPSAEAALPEAAAVFARGNQLMLERRYGDALACFLEAVERAPLERGYVQRAAKVALRLERFQLAWPLLERTRDLRERPDRLGYPKWDGSPLGSRCLLVWLRQGHTGSEIRDASMLADAGRLGGRIAVECDPRLVPLFRRSFGAVEVHARKRDRWPLGQRADVVQASYEAIACRLRAERASFPAAAYFVADAARTARLRSRYRALGGGLLVGVSWGSANAKKALPPLTDWSALLATPGVTFVSLQYGDFAAQAAELERLSGVEVHRDAEIDPMRDLDAAAAQTAAMDLVVTVSSTTAHLAGALGVPTWVLLDEEPLLSWPIGALRTAFYPSVELLWRQPQQKWSGLLAGSGARLAAVAKHGVEAS
jgi:hypothetical protein